MYHYSAELVQNVDEFCALRSSWTELLAQVEYPTIFLTWEWISTWIKNVYPEADLFIIVVRDEEGKVVGIAPFYCTDFTLFSFFKYKTLRVLGDCHSGAEYPDILVSPDVEEAVLKQISNLLFANKCKWDTAWFPNIASWTNGLQRFKDGVNEQKVLFFRTKEIDFSSILLPSTWKEYMAMLPGKRRSLLRRQERKAEKEFQLKLEVCEREEDMNEFLDHLFVLHRKRWELAGQEGAFVRRPLMVDFYRKMAPFALEKGWLALFSLSVNGQVMASQYGYIYNQIFSQLQEGFEPDAPSGIGNVLRQHVIRWCIENNVNEYDFLGGFSAHKKQWKSERRQGYSLFLGRKCLKNIIFNFLPIWPSGRYMSQGLPEES